MMHGPMNVKSKLQLYYNFYISTNTPIYIFKVISCSYTHQFTTVHCVLYLDGRISLFHFLKLSFSVSELLSSSCALTCMCKYKITFSNNSHPVILKVIYVPTGTGGIVTGLWVG